MAGVSFRPEVLGWLLEDVAALIGRGDSPVSPEAGKEAAGLLALVFHTHSLARVPA